MSPQQPAGGPPGVTIVNRARLRHPPAAIFGLLADPEREPDWNDKLLAVEPLTPGPPRAGSRFRATFGWPVGESVITYDEVEAPHRWRTHSTSRRLDVHLEASIEETGGVSEVTVSTTLLPRGPLRLLRGVVARTMQQSWDHHLDRIDRLLDPS